MSGLEWGAGGVSAYNNDKQQQESHDLDMASGRIKLQSATMLLNQQQQQMQMLQASGLMQGADGSQSNSPKDLTNSLYQLADIYARTGDIDKAAETTSRAATIADQQAKIDISKQVGTLKKLNLFGAMMTDVKDEGSWKQANALYELQTGEKSPYKDLPYDPTMVQQLKDGVLAGKTKALTALDQMRIDRQKSLIEKDKYQEQLIKAQIKNADARTEHLDKVGAAKIPASYVSNLSNRIREDYGNMDAPTARAKALNLSERVDSLVKDQHLTVSQATEKAFQEAKVRGDFAGQMKTGVRGTLANPIKAAPGMKFKDDTWYDTPKGLLRYNAATGKFTDQGAGGNREDDTSQNEEPKDDDDEEEAA